MTDWATISSLATAGGTLVLAVATFSSVRSGNRTARSAEAALQVGLRPVLASSHLEDPPEKINFLDGRWLRVPGGHAAAEVTDDVIYLGIALRNFGQGIAVLHGWHLSPGTLMAGDGHAEAEAFRRLSRDIYVPAGGRGFWQGALRDPEDNLFRQVRAAVEERQRFTIDILYGDHEGGQRTITRFGVAPAGDDGWMSAAARHWNLDRQDPR